jgi:hypothetical protein
VTFGSRAALGMLLENFDECYVDRIIDDVSTVLWYRTALSM